MDEEHCSGSNINKQFETKTTNHKHTTTMNELLMKLFLEFGSKTLNKTEKELADLLFAKADGSELKPDALNSLLSLDVTRVKSFDDKVTTAHDKGYNKGKAESLGTFEIDIKKHFGMEAIATKGVDLVQSIIDAKVTAKTPTDDDVKRHPLFLSETEKLKQEKAETEKTLKGELETFVNTTKKTEMFREVKSVALKMIDDLKPKLPADEKKAMNQKEAVLSHLTDFDFEKQGDSFIMMKDGKPHKDAHGHVIKFEDFLKEKADTMWEFDTTQKKTAPGNNNNPQPANNQQQQQQQQVKFKWNGVKPANESEMMKLVSEAETSQERIAIAESWKGTS